MIHQSVNDLWKNFSFLIELLHKVQIFYFLNGLFQLRKFTFSELTKCLEFQVDLGGIYFPAILDSRC